MFSYVGNRFDAILNGYATSVASAFMSYGFPVLAAATALNSPMPLPRSEPDKMTQAQS